MTESVPPRSTVRDTLFRLYGPVQRLIVPELRNSQQFYKSCLRRHVTSETRWLDLGCGHKLLPDWMPNAEQEQREIVHGCKLAVGIDVDHLSLQKNSLVANRLRGDIERLPFPDKSFDLVTANVVVEHVQDPARLLAEIHRVLRPGGKFLFHTPNFFGYATLAAWIIPERVKRRLVYLLQRRAEEDVFPTFYRLNSGRAVRGRAAETGFGVCELHLVETSALTVMLGPVVVVELLWIALLRLPMLKALRTNLVGVLQRPLL